MKIIFSSYDDIKNPYYAGGGARAVHEVAKHLTADHQVTVITGRYRGCKNEVVDGVVYVRAGAGWVGAKMGQLIYQLSLLPKLLAGNFDVWVESFTPPFSTSFLPLFTKKPVIGLVHMLSGEDMTRKYRLPIFAPVEKLGLGLYKFIITPSGVVKEKIKSVNPGALITVIPNGVDGGKKPAKVTAKKHILFLGRIEVDQKGLDLLLTAYAKIVKQVKYPLVIAGSGEKSELSKLILMIEKLGIRKGTRKRVRLAGRVEGERKRKLLEEALFVVIPSRFETFSVTALEAMAEGKGLITFDIPGLRWIPEGIAIKVPCFDVQKLGGEMLKLSFGKTLLSRMGAAEKSFVKKYSWENISAKYERFISNTVDKASHE